MFEDKISSFFKDDLGRFSMARLSIAVALLMGVYTGAVIPFFGDGMTNVIASMGYFTIALTGKVATKFSEKG